METRRLPPRSPWLRASVCAALLAVAAADRVSAQEDPAIRSGQEPALPRGALARIGSPFLRAAGETRHIALSPDGTYLATASEFEEIRIWNLADRTWRIPFPQRQAAPAADALAFSADGTRLAAVSDRFLDYDLNTQARRAMPIPPLGSTVSLAQGRDGAWIVVDESMLLRVESSRVQRFGGGHRIADPHTIALSRDGSRTAVSDSEEGLLLIDPRSGAVVAQFGELPELDLAVASVGGGRAVLAGGYEGGVVFVFDEQVPGERLGFLAHERAVIGVALSADGARLATIDEEGSLRTWDAGTGTMLADIVAPFEDPGAITLSADGRVVALAGAHGARAWDAVTGEPVIPGIGSPDPITRAALSPDGRVVAEYGSDAHVRIWDVGAGEPRSLPLRHVAPMAGLAFGADGMLATADQTGIVRRWDLANGVTLPLQGGHGEGARSIAFSPDGAHLVVGGGDASLDHWDAATGAWTGDTYTAEFLADEDVEFVDAVAWSPDGARIALTGKDEELVILRAVGGARLVSSDDVSGRTTCLVWSPDARRIASVRDGTLRLLDTTTLEIAWSDAADWRVAAFSPDGTLLLAADAFGRVTAFDVRTLAPVGKRTAHALPIHSLAFSADGTRVLTSAATALVWDTEQWLGRKPGLPVPRPDWTPPDPGAPLPPRAPPVVTGLGPGESSSVHDGFLPGATPSDRDAFLVIDGVTGLPLEGATVALFPESETAPPGRLLAESRTDPHGLAHLPRTDGYWIVHIHVSAPGRATQHWYVNRQEGSIAEPPRVVTLFPESPMRGRLLGPLGEPAQGVRIELFRGCGHSPGATWAVTDDDGHFDLPAYTREGRGQLWPVGAGFASRYLDVDALTSLGSKPYTWVLRPGYDLHGRVVAADGWPVAGATLKSLDTYRGPIVETDATGSFVLTGISGEAEFHLWDAIPAGTQTFIPNLVPWLRPSAPLTILRPHRFRSFEEQDDHGRAPYTFVVTDAQSGETVDADRLCTTELATGWQYQEALDPEAGATVSLRTGKHLIAVGGPFSPYASPPVEVDLPRTFETVVNLTARAQPPAVIELPEGLDDPELYVVAGGAGGDADASETLHLPAEGPAALHVTAEGITRVFRFGPVADGKRTVVVDWPERKRVVLPPLPENGPYEPLTCDDAAIEVIEEPDAAIVLTHAAGSVTLRIVDDELGEALVRVELPDEPGAVVRVPEFPWAPPPVARFAVTRDGTPVGEDHDLDVLAGDPSDGELTRFDLEFEDPDLVVVERDWAAPRAVELQADGLVPLRVVVPGDVTGVLPVRWGNAGVRVVVTTPDDAPPVVAAWIDGGLVTANAGVLELGGLHAGEHVLIVGTARHGAQRMVLHIADGAQRNIDVQFR